MALILKLAAILSMLLIASCKQTAHNRFLSISDIDKIRQEFNLPKDQTFILDTTYLRYLFTLDKSRYSNAIKNHYQPLQAAYYDNKGQLVSFHVNCYASIGVAEGQALNWNQSNAFDTFLPSSVAPLDSILPLNMALRFIKTVDNNPIDTIGYSSHDYTILVFWNKTLYKQDALNLINTVNDNMRKARGKKVKVLYVNNDNNWR